MASMTRWHLKKDPVEVREPAMWISWGEMFQAQGTASLRDLRWEHAGQFLQQQEAIVAGRMREEDIAEVAGCQVLYVFMVHFEDFGFHSG